MKWNPLTYEQINHKYARLYKENKEAAEFYSKCIRLMHLIVQDMAKVKATEYMKTKKHITGARAMSELYEIKIIHEFTAHQTLLKRGLCIASYSHLRSVYETIIKIYLNITNPKLGDLNVNYEIRENNKELTPEQIKKIEKDFFDKKWLKTSFIEQKIYSGKTLESMRAFYRHICSLIHPTITSLAACFEVKPNVFLDTFKLGIGMTTANFIILFELYGNQIKMRYRKKLFALVKEFPRFIPEGVPAMIPSNNTDKLKIKQYNELIDILENKKTIS